MPLPVDNLTPDSGIQAIRDAISKSIQQCMEEGGREQSQCALGILHHGIAPATEAGAAILHVGRPTQQLAAIAEVELHVGFQPAAEQERPSLRPAVLDPDVQHIGRRDHTQ